MPRMGEKTLAKQGSVRFNWLQQMQQEFSRDNLYAETQHNGFTMQYNVQCV